MNGVSNPFSGGWVARFRDEEELLAAAKMMAKHEFSEWDVIAPWPCSATRLVSEWSSFRFPLKWLSICGCSGALIGAVLLVLWIFFTQADIPLLVVQGRFSGWASWPALVPPLFESVLLGAGLGVIFGMLKGGDLPNWYHWAFDESHGNSTFPGDGFFIVASFACGDNARIVLENMEPLEMNAIEACAGRVSR